MPLPTDDNANVLAAEETAPTVTDTSPRSSIPADPLFPIVSDENALSGLPEALREFRRGSEREDGGRSGMHHALLVAVVFLGSRVPQGDKVLMDPLMCLMRALRDLDRGCLHPALRPITVRNRKPTRSDVADFKARCLVAADTLNCRGGLGRKDADQAITERMESLAGRLGFRMTQKSLATWRRSAQKAFESEGLFMNNFGRHVWMARGLARDLEAYEVPAQISCLLEAVSEERLSHLALPEAETQNP